ncbi:ribonuclease H family protein, partial [Aspergillus affinis]|uniref:ribonuclease H family protein n=1 Tax=Aspergillus affinis TaxID=1070780 RepID=UPI0022FF1367
MIGVAAVSIRAGRTARKHLETELDSTVYVGELEGTRMALDRAKPIPVTVFSDSQAAIQAVRNPGWLSGQYALRAIYGRIRALRSESLEDTELRWIFAHIGVEGNEKADKIAKGTAIKGLKLSPAIRYVTEFMQQTGLLQQFRFARLDEEDDEEA